MKIEEINELIGLKFNMISVISYSHKKKKPKKGWYYYYNCKCDCGNSIISERAQIKNKSKKSCGCQGKLNTIKFNKTKKKYNKYDLSGEYGIGYTFKNECFYFDKEDYEKIKDYCWHMGNRGYIMCTINKNKEGRHDLLFHRLVTDCKERNMDVDHINGITTRNDNRKQNLRVCSHSQNMMNRLLSVSNSSGVTGVGFCKTHKVWKSHISKDGKKYSLGSFDNIEDAIVARLKAEKEYFGEFSGQKHLYEKYNI